MLAHEGKIVVEHYAHDGDVEVREVIGAEDIRTLWLRAVPIRHHNGHPDYGKKELPPETVEAMRNGLPTLMLKAQKHQWEKQQE
jgi:hypothetical protein